MSSLHPYGITWDDMHDFEFWDICKKYRSKQQFFTSAKYKKYRKLLNQIKIGSINHNKIVIGKKYAILSLTSNLEFLRISVTNDLYELTDIIATLYTYPLNTIKLKTPNNDLIKFPSFVDNEKLALNYFIYEDIELCNKALVFMSLQPYDVTIYSY